MLRARPRHNLGIEQIWGVGAKTKQNVPKNNWLEVLG